MITVIIKQNIWLSLYILIISLNYSIYKINTKSPNWRDTCMHSQHNDKCFYLFCRFIDKDVMKTSHIADQCVKNITVSYITRKYQLVLENYICHWMLSATFHVVGTQVAITLWSNFAKYEYLQNIINTRFLVTQRDTGYRLTWTHSRHMHEGWGSNKLSGYK